MSDAGSSARKGTGMRETPLNVINRLSEGPHIYGASDQKKSQTKLSSKTGSKRNSISSKIAAIINPDNSTRPSISKKVE